MIQRIQSVWLFLAALTMTGMFYIPIYKLSDSPTKLTIGNDYIAILLTAISILLSLVALFSFKKRKSQLGLSWINIFVMIGFLLWLFFSISRFKALPEHEGFDGYFWIGSFIPLITIVFLALAIRGIRKDEKLLRSLDRLR